VDIKEDKLNSEKPKKAFRFHKIFIVSAIIVALIAVVVIVLFVFSKKGTQVNKNSNNDNYMEMIQNFDIKVSDDASLNSFIKNYYNAIADGNIDLLKSMYDSKLDLSEFDEISNMVEGYSNFEIYAIPGINENELAIFVRYDVKFYNIDTLAPSVDCLYLSYDKDGNYKINSDMESNAEIVRYLTLCSYRDPIKSLLTETNDELEIALKSDKNLNNLYVVMNSITNAFIENDDNLSDE